jgi:two-component system chemotaxis sensor kinase CheA
MVHSNAHGITHVLSKRLSIVFAFFTAAVTIGISVSGSAYLYQRQAADAEVEARDRGERTSAMLARVLSQPVADYDLTTMESHLEGSLKDPEVLKVDIVDGKGDPVTAKEKTPPASDDWLYTKAIERNGEKVGDVKVSFSSKRFKQEALGNLLRSAVLTLVTVFGIVLAIVGLFGTLIGKRLNSLVTVCQEAKSGNLKARAIPGRDDELGTLAEAFNTMLQQVESSRAEVERKNKELEVLNSGLERLVAERTATIRTILDHVTFGLMIVDRKMVVQPGYSKSCIDILSQHEGIDKKLLPDLLGMDTRARKNFEALFEQVFDSGMILSDVTLSQLPARCSVGKTTIGLGANVVEGPDGDVQSVLFSIADISALVRAEIEIENNRGLIKILSNRDSFRNFVLDAKATYSRMYEALNGPGGSQATVRRDLHTVKGNAGVFGLSQLIAAIHDLESQSSISTSGVEATENLLREFLQANKQLIDLPYDAAVEESFAVPARLVDRIEETAENKEANELKDLFKAFFATIRLKNARTVLKPLSAAFAQLATRLDKQAVLQIEGEDTQVNPAGFVVLSNIIHLIRNALDHGLESGSERGTKPRVGTIKLAISHENDRLKISVSDDGRGVDVQRMLEKSIEKGQVTREAVMRMSETEKFGQIFHLGVSTAKNVSDISGRGIGLGAVYAAVQKSGGTINVKSQLGVGTTFVIEIPMAMDRFDTNRLGELEAKRVA